MKLFISFILGIGCLAKVVNASLAALSVPFEFPFLFNAVAVFNYPSWSTRQPREGTLEGANFYCYATEVGFLTFGWYGLHSPAAYIPVPLWNVGRIRLLTNRLSGG